MSPPIPNPEQGTSLETPDSHRRDPDAHLPVTRGEFRQMLHSVARIERGMFGENPYEGKGLVAEHLEMRKKMAFFSKIAWLAFAAACAALWGIVKPRLFGP